MWRAPQPSLSATFPRLISIAFPSSSSASHFLPFLFLFESFPWKNSRQCRLQYFRHQYLDINHWLSPRFENKFISQRFFLISSQFFRDSSSYCLFWQFPIILAYAITDSSLSSKVATMDGEDEKMKYGRTFHSTASLLWANINSRGNIKISIISLSINGRNRRESNFFHFFYYSAMKAKYNKLHGTRICCVVRERMAWSVKILGILILFGSLLKVEKGPY